MATQDGSGCPLTVALDLRKGQAGAVWSALTVLDDSPEALGRDENAHHRRWQAWLYWTNLLQFLNEGEGDGVQLAASQLPGFDPVELAVTGGVGWLESRRQRPAPEQPAEEAGRRPLPSSLRGLRLRPREPYATRRGTKSSTTWWRSPDSPSWSRRWCAPPYPRPRPDSSSAKPPGPPNWPGPPTASESFSLPRRTKPHAPRHGTATARTRQRVDRADRGGVGRRELAAALTRATETDGRPAADDEEQDR
ncbi:hypothetical protein NKH18_38505 [Streptomyces sp. M10(2022)]